MAKPNDFFVGIIDLFAILLPGGVLTFALMAAYQPFFDEVVSLSGAQGWVAFLFGSYLLGHIIFMLGARLDYLYDSQRKKNNPYTNESAYQCASNIKNNLLRKEEIDSVNTYHWSISFLTTHYPEAMVEINRLVADSKFFRSLVVILPVVSFILFTSEHYWHAIIFIALIVPCYLRYYGRRLKSTTRAYQYIVMLNGLGKIKSPDH
jgi:hypothetical protein